MVEVVVVLAVVVAVAAADEPEYFSKVSTTDKLFL
jgi:hypothetical protein